MVRVQAELSVDTGAMAIAGWTSQARAFQPRPLANS